MTASSRKIRPHFKNGRAALSRPRPGRRNVGPTAVADLIRINRAHPALAAGMRNPFIETGADSGQAPNGLPTEVRKESG